jgi:DNA-binding MarR family transcriptional regulator
MTTIPSKRAAEALMRLEPVYQGKFSRNIRSLADETLTHLQIQALFLLRDAGPMAMHEIAAHLHMSKQHLTRFVDALVRRGLLLRFQKPGDRRTVYIKVADEGLAALNGFYEQALQIIGRIVSKLPVEKQEELADAALKMFEIMESISVR